jgi:hypothetical protein
VVTGTVRDAAGRPLAGVQVFADNTLFYNTNAIGVTDAQGRYRIDVSQPIGTWRMSAQLTREFEGRTYRFNPQPTVNDAFAGVDGAVRDFTWRLDGRTPSGGHYGARVYTRVLPVGFLYDSDDNHVEITMTPVGPLVDGSTGTPRTIRGDSDFAAYHVPLGRYRITARYAPPGVPPRDAVLRVAAPARSAPRSRPPGRPTAAAIRRCSSSRSRRPSERPAPRWARSARTRACPPRRRGLPALVPGAASAPDPPSPCTPTSAPRVQPASDRPPPHRPGLPGTPIRARVPGARRSAAHREADREALYQAPARRLACVDGAAVPPPRSTHRSDSPQQPPPACRP